MCLLQTYRFRAGKNVWLRKKNRVFYALRYAKCRSRVGYIARRPSIEVAAKLGLQKKRTRVKQEETYSIPMLCLCEI